MDYKAERDDTHQRFLAALIEKAAGDTQKQVSMYQIGTAMELSKAETSRIAEDLMVDGLVEIRSLSGAIGLTPAAVSDYSPESHAPAGAVVLGNSKQIKAEALPVLENLLKEIKNKVAGLTLDFDDMSECTADIRTIEAQLASSRPKTAILRAILESLLELMQRRHGPEQLRRQLENFLL